LSGILNTKIFMVLFLTGIFIFSAQILPAGGDCDKPRHPPKTSFSKDASLISITPAGIYTRELEGTPVDFYLQRRINPWNRLFDFFEKLDFSNDRLSADINELIWQPWKLKPQLSFGQLQHQETSFRRIIVNDIIHPVIDALDYWQLGRADNETTTYPDGMQTLDYFSEDKITNLFAFSGAILFTKRGCQFLQSQPWTSNWLMTKLEKMNFFIVPSGGVLLKYNFKF